MEAVQRAFAQRLQMPHAGEREMRRQVASPAASRPDSRLIHSSSVTSVPDVVDPLDVEDYIASNLDTIKRDPLGIKILDPRDDVLVHIEPRIMRTTTTQMPKGPIGDCHPFILDCIRFYTNVNVFVTHECGRRQLSPSRRKEMLMSVPGQEYDVDVHTCYSFSDTSSDDGSQYAEQQQVAEDLEVEPNYVFCHLFQQPTADELDKQNQVQRNKNRQDCLFLLYPTQSCEEAVERRFSPEPPQEPPTHRIHVKCLQLRLDLEVEPIFASMALYDAKERKKVSENFYFDLNSESLRRMVEHHVGSADLTTKSRECVFTITNPSPDMFIVVKIEKVLQGDINECAEPYMKEEKNVDKVRVLAAECCERLGKYRMPLAWTAVPLVNVLTGSSDTDSTPSDSHSIGSNSLDRKSSSSNFEQLRRRASDMGSLSRRGSLDRRCNGPGAGSGAAPPDKRHSWSPDDLAHIDNFRPVTITVPNFFKQEGDKLRDEDLYKLLQELKRPSSGLKKLKMMGGCLRLEFAPGSVVRGCVTTELDRIHPAGLDDVVVPVKELLEFPVKEILEPHLVYRNLMFVYPKELNFTNRAVGSARNLAVRLQLMHGADEQPLPAIFGKSSGPEFCSDAFSAVTYHNKCPNFYDEFKILLPPSLNDKHHLLFTFYHISCQRKQDQPTVETPVGYTWLPLLKLNRLQTGEHTLPVTTDKPVPNYFYVMPDPVMPGIRWSDKNTFTCSLESVTSVHTQDEYLDNFFHLCAMIERDGGGGEKAHPWTNTFFSSGLETDFTESILSVEKAKFEPLIKFLPIVLDKLTCLLVKIVKYNDCVMDVAMLAFESLVKVVYRITTEMEVQGQGQGQGQGQVQGQGQGHVGHCPLLANYVAFLANPVFPDITDTNQMHRSNSNPDISVPASSADSEVAAILRGLDRARSLRQGPCQGQESRFQDILPNRRRVAFKFVHEEIVCLWNMSAQSVKSKIMACSWFFFDLIIKSMVTHLEAIDGFSVPRKNRFHYGLVDGMEVLVKNIVTSIVASYNTDLKLVTGLNTSLAFFLRDLFSCMDRGVVLNLIKIYCKEMNERILRLQDGAVLYNLKMDSVRVVCSHEHFLSLNLAFNTPLTGHGGGAPPPSPTPSQASSGSAGGSGQSRYRCRWAELSLEFRQQHYLAGLLLADLACALSSQNGGLHLKAVNMLRNQMYSVDFDSRFANSAEAKARFAALYLPVITITMDLIPQLHNPKDKKSGGLEQGAGAGAAIDQSVAMAIAGLQLPQPVQLGADVSRHLLLCCLWVLKHLERSVLCHWLAQQPASRLRHLLQLLHLCLSVFEYKGKKAWRNSSQQFSTKTVDDIKSRLEDVILGQGSARSEMMMRRKDRNPSSGGTAAGERLRWRRDQVCRPAAANDPHDLSQSGHDTHLEANLSTELSLVVLDTVEHLVQVCSVADHLQMLLGSILKVVLHGLALNQSTVVLNNMFASQRAIVFKFPGLLFEEEAELLVDLCFLLFKHCKSPVKMIRSYAAASLYLLMRQNYEVSNIFARVKSQVTLSLSSLHDSRETEQLLRASLKTIEAYAREDHTMTQTEFFDQVKKAVSNLETIIANTSKMRKFKDDPDMLFDLMYSTADSYKSSPDLRLTWLANMARKHMELNQHTEAAMCLVHSAALVAEQLRLQEGGWGGRGAVALQGVSPNVEVTEAGLAEDVVGLDEDGLHATSDLGKDFTLSGFTGLLEHAANSFCAAGMYEAMNATYKVMIPIAEEAQDWKKLSNIHGKLQDAFNKIDQLQGRRVFSTYYRVAFYGKLFDDSLNNKEFIYKEPNLTKLTEIFTRLEKFYAERFGAGNVIIIQDSSPVDVSSLDPTKAYIQITYVEPYFEPQELRARKCDFERNFNIRQFIFSTPFTMEGKAHGLLSEQFKRKTILVTEKFFPFVKTRIQVVKREQMVLAPIEVAIEDLEQRTNMLAEAIQQDPVDPKILQMVLQGCIGTQVNIGGVEMAKAFLDVHSQKLTVEQNKLRLRFKAFIKKCQDALKKNKHLIGPDQREYQRELERNFTRFSDEMHRLLTRPCRH